MHFLDIIMIVVAVGVLGFVVWMLKAFFVWGKK